MGDDGDVPEDPLVAPRGAGSADVRTGESVVDLPGENEWRDEAGSKPAQNATLTSHSPRYVAVHGDEGNDRVG